MNNKKVVVENILTPYKDYLKDNGYDVYTLYNNENLNNITTSDYKAIVVSGLDVLSTIDASYSKPPVPIIETKGKTPEEVYNLLESRYS